MTNKTKMTVEQRELLKNWRLKLLEAIMLIWKTSTAVESIEAVVQAIITAKDAECSNRLAEERGRILEELPEPMRCSVHTKSIGSSCLGCAGYLADIDILVRVKDILSPTPPNND